MRLTLLLQEDSREITLFLEDRTHAWKENASSADELVESLDKMLKKANIDVRSIRNVKLTCPPKTSLTSFRLAKTFQQALTITIDKA